jgi:hypothetical protein
MHKLVLAEIPSATIALRLKDEALGKLFGTSQTLRDMMSDAECYSAYNFAKVYTKKPTEVSWNEWNNAKDGSVGAVVREAIQRLINNARYARQDANLAETIKVRQMLAFLSNLPALAKVKIIKVKKIHDDEPQSQRSRRANRSVAVVSPVVVNELEMAY